jgi:hypothetical protein
VVDRVGRRRIPVAERVIGQGGQADHGVVAGAMFRLDIPDVEPGAETGILRSGAEVATLIEAEVETFHRVSGGAQERNKDGSDVAAITCYEDPHW